MSGPMRIKGKQTRQRFLDHNFSISKDCKMEGDYNDSNGTSSSPTMNDLTNLLTNLSSQITSQNEQLKCDIHQVVAKNDVFKQEVRLLIGLLAVGCTSLAWL